MLLTWMMLTWRTGHYRNIYNNPGGFTVWPKSHVRLYHTHTDEWHWSPTDENEAALNNIIATTQVSQPASQPASQPPRSNIVA